MEQMEKQIKEEMEEEEGQILNEVKEDN